MHIYISCSLLFSIFNGNGFDLRLINGVFFSWIYMRFYMIRGNSKTRGDRSINFSFSAFFPSIMQKYIEPISTKAFDQSIKMGIIPGEAIITTGTMVDKTTVYEREEYAFLSLGLYKI